MSAQAFTTPATAPAPARPEPADLGASSTL